VTAVPKFPLGRVVATPGALEIEARLDQVEENQQATSEAEAPMASFEIAGVG
jgi:hypothetical protein